MVHILTIHFKDKWIDIQKRNLEKYLSEPYKVYSRIGENFELLNYKLNIISSTWGNQFSLQSFAILLSKFKKYEFDLIFAITLSIFIILSFSFYKFFQNILENVELDEGNFKYRLYMVSSNFIICADDYYKYFNIFMLLCIVNIINIM